MASLFFTVKEREAFVQQRADAGFLNQWNALRARVFSRAAKPGLSGSGVTTAWWYHAAEFLSDAAVVQAADATDNVGRWLRAATLEMVRRSEDDWIGPYYRDHSQDPPIGHLETAHLAIGVAIVMDVAPEVFSDGEIDEVRGVLRDRAIPLCVRWLDFAERLNNWRCILAGGLAVASAITGNEAGLERARSEFELCCELFQSDGSYAESLQYANYASWGLMLMYESLFRTGRADGLSIDAYAPKVLWDAYSYLYTKPLSRWGASPLPRAVNFNDSAAVYRPGGDVLMHIAARAGTGNGKAGDDGPPEAPLARWLYDLHYGAELTPNSVPHELSTFGLFNTAGFLSLILFATSSAPKSPADLAYPAAAAFDNGDVIVRRRWNGDTVLAIRAGGALLNGPSHLHGDMNSFTLTHKKERLLVDGGHSCYRNLTRPVETDARSHNTCVFIPGEKTEQDVRQEDLFKGGVISQEVEFKRDFSDGRPGPPVDRGTRLLHLASDDSYSAIVGEAAAVYGETVRRFTRSWLMIGDSLIVVADELEFGSPCRTEWNWILNNRDGRLDVEQIDGGLVARRGGAGMLLINNGGAGFGGPYYGLLHDSYHPEPSWIGEGRPGSALVYRLTSREPLPKEFRLHLVLLDSAARIGEWRLKSRSDGFTVTAPGGEGAAEIIGSPSENLVVRCSGSGAIPSATIERTVAGDYSSFSGA